MLSHLLYTERTNQSKWIGNLFVGLFIRNEFENLFHQPHPPLHISCNILTTASSQISHIIYKSLIAYLSKYIHKVNSFIEGAGGPITWNKVHSFIWHLSESRISHRGIQQTMLFIIFFSAFSISWPLFTFGTIVEWL